MVWSREGIPELILTNFSTLPFQCAFCARTELQAGKDNEPLHGQPKIEADEPEQERIGNNDHCTTPDGELNEETDEQLLKSRSLWCELNRK